MLSVFEKPNALLRLEGFGIFFLALTVFWQRSFDWSLCWSTVLLPDIALLGYLVNVRVGAITYNITHSKLLPCTLAVVAVAANNTLALALSLIWFIHIGIDRLFGYGLKYPEGFKITHLGVIGQVGNLAFNRYLPCGKLNL